MGSLLADTAMTVMIQNLDIKIKTMKKEYIKPVSKVVKIEVSRMLASSITGSAPDSDDSEFGAPTKAAGRGAWGDLWSEE